MANNFAINCHWKSYSTSLERSDSYLLGARSNEALKFSVLQVVEEKLGIEEISPVYRADIK